MAVAVTMTRMVVIMAVARMRRFIGGHRYREYRSSTAALLPCSILYSSCTVHEFAITQ
jgi:hypothetical protein